MENNKHKKRISSALVFLVIKIRKNIQFMYPVKCSEEKHVALLSIGEKGKRYYVFIKDFNAFMHNHILHHG